MKVKNILKRLDIISQCQEYKLPLWQCPQFFFLIMGIITIGMIISGYVFFTKKIDDPLLVARIVVGLGVVLLIINVVVSRSFGRVAEANQMKSEFIRIVSHQLRSPLSNIRWSVEFLTSGKLDKDKASQQKHFKILEENIDRMQELISKLLTVSRIEAGTLAPEVEAFSLNEVTQDLISKFKPLTEAFNVEVLLKVLPNLPKALGDPSQIKVVVENLLDNAIRYTQRSQPHSEIYLGRGKTVEKGKVEIIISQRGNQLYFEIKDNGVGIPKDCQKYIFQKFFRGKTASKQQTLGSGLGLYISKSIIEKSGGKMGFKSRLGEGSTFWFTLPTK
ncbi:MAG: hypothetical protein CO031_02865 [Candidatus Nealsonbacteria bacterium CG_4_9_14_0_2_um_filter_37_38]|uniref:histidine kinase n=1 Tax=Candidatus Nealsonbacteria bacterium CG_4_10_14_0_8_um_filter_37_14 TaxID=1974684 RepID=A0A2M7R5F9_9BACT|nr:MAG: hypothetical protein COV63_00650 [Candidatus Nealsonbacteria bacterium CG11_big_fil_rev_8_21_14_0_20_37_68]PIW92239.1 MAG: hypothetical protein COZ89_01040 [Candidatus Nealsonbacteria bacterium CG_4_8_14_3_um_filter_37_23]PIY88512.1 MAG: hypothetical protein COY73_03515 [Candidatus Nealsonbacteria bacterium CG_4_10_14_0_8_um_filter_37_14]PJC51401.1 MAG: hypothetical protein CO031_02865 [Candidatus Nealsonbacteria bacterium CG_4_9_14_0_2_um_filter_37_38]